MRKSLQNKRHYLDRENIASIPDESGVYFLYQTGNVLVYIGKANAIRRRVLTHDKEKAFCRISYELTHFSRARTLEKRLIDIYVKEHGQFPYYNRRH